MTVLPVGDVRDQLSRLVSDVETYGERVQISRRGRPAAILLSQDDYDSLLETLDIMSDTALMAELKQAMIEDRAEAGISGQQLVDRMQALRDRTDA